jgi:hypothetical protein
MQEKTNCLYDFFLVPNVGLFFSELGIDLILNKLEQQKGKLLVFFYTKYNHEIAPTDWNSYFVFIFFFIYNFNEK